MVPEPAGGAHSDWVSTAEALRAALLRHLGELRALPAEALLGARWEKYMKMGEWRTVR